MDPLRLSLLALGILLVAAVYLAERWRRRNVDVGGDEDNRIPVLTHVDPLTLIDDPLADGWQVSPIRGERGEPMGESIEALQGLTPEQTVQPPVAEPTIQESDANAELHDENASATPPDYLILTLMSNGEPLSGRRIDRVLKGADFNLGDDGLYRHSELFLQVANVLEPGRFTRSGLLHMSTPGLVALAPWTDAETSARVIECLERLSEDLTSDLCDERRRPLTPQQRAELVGLSTTPATMPESDNNG